jgi:RHS repeat-associated protein
VVACALQHGGWKSFEAQTGPTGTVTGTRQFDAFGAQVASTGSWQGALAHGGGYGYQSDDTGLQLLGHRYYDPSTGRFLTRDPIKDGPNWYAYCLNDPVNHTDPTGLSFSIGGFEFTAQVWADGLGTSAKALAGMLTDSVTDAPLWFLLRKLQIYDLRNPFNDAFGGEAGYGESKIFWMIGLAAASGAAGAAGAAGRGLRGACFTAGTPIVMADGSTKPIEEVRPGDRVLSQPQEGGDPVVSTVDRTFERKAEETLVLTFSDGSTVETTDEHPFYVPGKGWTAAKALRAGTAVESLSGPGLESESASRIVSVRAAERPAKVYNFEVAGTHTYYVAAGDSAVWVHNVCLRRIHSDETLRGSSSYRYWKGKPTSEVEQSL